MEKAGSLDSRFRRWFQKPAKIVGPYIREGMTVMDMGCGPGFFTIEIARLVGTSGRVIAADLQEGMLEKVREKIRGTELEELITLHRCEEERIGVSESVDFILAFYLVHEVPDKERFFQELAAILKPGGRMLVVEPPLHVSKRELEETITAAGKAGFVPAGRPKIFPNKAVLLKR